MKRCDYCGRENDDSAVHCAECGTTAFIDPRQPPRDTPSVASLISKRTKLLYVIGGFVVLLVLVLCLRSGVAPMTSAPPVALAFPGKPVVGSNGLTFVISNCTDASVFYLNYPVQLLSNGVWLDTPFTGTTPRRMLTLASGQATNIVISAPTNHLTFRLSILWGYQPRFTPWSLVRAWINNLFTGSGKGYQLQTYTNYSDAITLP